MQYDPDKLPPPIRSRPTRPRLVSINDEQLAERRAAISSLQGSDISMETPMILSPLVDEDDDPTEPRIKSVRFKPLPVTGDQNNVNAKDEIDDISEQSTINLKQLSGMMPAIKRPPKKARAVGHLRLVPALTTRKKATGRMVSSKLARYPLSIFMAADLSARPCRAPRP